MKQFAIQESISYGWKEFKKNPWLLIGISLVMTFIPSVVSYVLQLPFQNPRSPDEYHPLMAIGSIASFVISSFFTLGIIKLYLKILDGKKVEFQDIFNVKADQFVSYIIGSIIYVLIIVGGFILLIIPGIIWGIKYQYFPYLIIDKKLSPMDAIKLSGKITQGNKMHLFIFSIVLGLLSILGVLALFVGMFVAMPVVGIAQAYVYRKLAAKQ